MRPDPSARAEFVAAFREMTARIEHSLSGVAKRALPIRMFVGGGAALHFYTGARVSEDVDAAFSHRIALPEQLDIAYRDADGAARLLYFDYQFNDTLGLMHERAHDDSVPLALDGIDALVLDVRLLSPVDLATSKLGRYMEHDRADIEALAKHGLIKAKALRKRAEAAAGAYVGDVARVHHTIDLACRMVEDVERSQTAKPVRQRHKR